MITGGICPQELCSLPGLKGARLEESAGECVVALGMCGPACDGYAGTDLGLSQALDSRPPDGRRQGGMCGEAWNGGWEQQETGLEPSKKFQTGPQ